MTNSEALMSKIAQSGKTKRHLAKMLGISTQGLYNKINNKTEFKASEIRTLSNELDITTVKERDLIFFSQ